MKIPIKMLFRQAYSARRKSHIFLIFERKVTICSESKTFTFFHASTLLNAQTNDIDESDEERNSFNEDIEAFNKAMNADE